MRKLMWFTIGYGAASAFCAYFWICSGLYFPAFLTGAAGIGALILGKRRKQLKVAGFLLLGVGAGLLWFQGYSAIYLSEAANLDGKCADVSVCCTDYSYQTDYGTAVEGFLYLNGKPCRGKFYVSGEIAMEPGDQLEGCFEFRVTTQDAQKGATYHQGKGIFLLGYQEEDARLVKAQTVPLWAYPAVLRHELVEIIDTYFPEDTAPFAKALLLGDRTDLSYELNTVFKTSGIMHIIAVSGLHVTILFTLVNMVLFKRRWLVALVGIPVLVLFAAVAGFTPSVIRACIMQCLMICATLFNREYDGPTELSFASLAMLAVNPLVITSVSFQLSVGCMIGIFLMQKPIYNWLCGLVSFRKNGILKRLWTGFAASVSVTLSATSLTTPLSAYYFGAVSLVGVLTNLLTLWAVSICFYGIVAVCATASLASGFSSLCAAGVSLVIRYILYIAKILSDLPMAAVYTVSIYIVAWIIFTYVLIVIFALQKEKKPLHLVGGILLALVLCIGATRLEPLTDDCRMTVLDVGQGQCILLQGDGRTYMVDCGGSYEEDTADLAAQTLLSQGTSKVDGVILTHFDSDHVGGILNFLTRIPADKIYVPDYPDGSGILEALQQTEAELIAVSDELQISFDRTTLRIYPPVVPESNNDSSLAVLFSRENCDIMITGDLSAFGERMLLRTYDLPEVDVLVAGHHGSKHSTCEELLDALNPQIVAISVGTNYYGHPAAELLERLEQHGCMIYRTDQQGTLLFRR